MFIVLLGLCQYTTNYKLHSHFLLRFTTGTCTTGISTISIWIICTSCLQAKILIFPLRFIKRHWSVSCRCMSPGSPWYWLQADVWNEETWHVGFWHLSACLCTNKRHLYKALLLLRPWPPPVSWTPWCWQTGPLARDRRLSALCH